MLRMSGFFTHRIKIGLWLAALWGLGAGLAGGAEAPAGPLRIAAEEWPPYEYLEGGKPRGINVEVAGRIFKRLGIPFEYQFYPFSRALMLAEKGEIEAIASLSYQPDRESKFYFTESQRAFGATGHMPDDYLWIAEYVFFLPRRAAGAFQFESYDQIKRNRYRVGLINHYSYNKEFTDAHIGTHFSPSALDALKALDRGEVDLVPMERTVGRWLVQRIGAQDSILSAASPIFTKPSLLAFTRASPYPRLGDVSAAFYRELRKMRDSGEYDSLCETFIKPDYLDRITRPLLFVCEEWAPFEYLENNRIVGIDAAVVEVIMQRLGIPYRIAFYPWSRAWMLAEKGKADAVLSVSYKKEREEVLYYTEGQRQFAESGVLPPDYLWLSEYVFFVMKKSAAQISFDSYAQLKEKGVRIGRNRDYTYDPAFLEAGFEGPVYPSTEAGLRGLVDGEIDLYPMDKMVGLAELRRLGLQDSITCLPKPLFSKPYLSPFCKKSDFPDLERIMKAFYRELRLLRASGEYDRLFHSSLQAINPSAATGP